MWYWSGAIRRRAALAGAKAKEQRTESQSNRVRAIEQPLSLTRLAHQRLRDAILAGQLKPGEIYNEMALAQEMGVSRTPVREALLELSSQGLVTFLPRKGVQVNYFDDHDVEEVFELRKLIELCALDKAIDKATSGEIKKLDGALRGSRDAAKKRDLDAFLQADRLFHHNVVELSGNGRMHAILDNLRDIIHVMSFEAVNRAERMDEVVGEHEEIMRSLRERDRTAACEALSRHLDLSKQAVLAEHRALTSKSVE